MRKYLPGMALAGIVALGCQNGGEASEPPEMIGMTTGAETEERKVEMPSEGYRMDRAEVLGIATAFNTSEIEAASFARENATQEDVQEVANMIEEDHAVAHQQEMQMAQDLGIALATDTPTIRDLQEQHRQAFDAVRAASGDEIGRIYVSTQIDLHRRADRMLEEQLIPAAEGDLAQHLRGLQQVVRRHERQLTEVQNRMEVVAEQPAPAMEETY